MQVLKFGGTSVANAENIKKVKEILQLRKGEKTIVVISALGGVTDELLKCGSLAANGEICYKESLAKTHGASPQRSKAIVAPDKPKQCIELCNATVQ